MGSSGSARTSLAVREVPEGVAPALAVIAARGTQVTPAAARVVEVPPALAGLLPEGGLRRGSTVAVGAGTAPGALSLILAMLAPASTAGAWCAAVGLPDLGLVAAAELGVALDRLALVPRPGDQWPVVVAALLESVDVVVVQPPDRVRQGDARRLVARARERAAVLVVLDDAGGSRMGGCRVGGWPEAADVRLEVTGATWSGLGRGHGHLQDREVEVTVTGRRGASRARSGRMRLPGTGRVATSDSFPVVDTSPAVDPSSTRATSPSSMPVPEAAPAARAG